MIGVAKRDKKTIFACFPHADDEISCVGTMANHVAKDPCLCHHCNTEVFQYGHNFKCQNCGTENSNDGDNNYCKKCNKPLYLHGTGFCRKCESLVLNW